MYISDLFIFEMHFNMSADILKECCLSIQWHRKGEIHHAVTCQVTLAFFDPPFETHDQPVVSFRLSVSGFGRWWWSPSSHQFVETAFLKLCLCELVGNLRNNSPSITFIIDANYPHKMHPDSFEQICFCRQHFLLYWWSNIFLKTYRKLYEIKY